MIVQLSYRGVFRQEQYETATVEGSLTLDSVTDAEWFDADDDLYQRMRAELYTLIGPVVRDAAAGSRYDGTETVIYEWEGLVNEAGNQAPHRQQGRVRRRG